LALGGGIRALSSLAEVELREGDLAAAGRHFEEVAQGFDGVHDFNYACILEALGESPAAKAMRASGRIFGKARGPGERRRLPRRARGRRDHGR